MENKCIECNKVYSSYQSLWIHNKKYHIKTVPNGIHIVSDGIQKVDITKKIYKCKKCEKEYNNKTSKYRHQKDCTLFKKNDIQQQQIEKLETKIEQLEKKVNKKVINTNHGNIYNGTVINNNITINKMGNENLSLLNDNEISQIFNKELESITTFIELLNFNERLPENHNHCTTSLESKYLSVYNSETNKIEKDRKKYFFDKLLNTSVDRIQILYNTNKNKFTKMKQKQIEENITHLKSFKNYDFNNKILKEMINKMNLITYNKRSLVQKTWHEDSDSDDDFQKDLEKETKEEFYKKLEMKEKLQLKYNSNNYKEIIKTLPSESDESESNNDIFLETYKN
jgi:hypothetical protein